MTAGPHSRPRRTLGAWTLFPLLAALVSLVALVAAEPAEAQSATVGSLQQLRALYGEEPRADDARLRIPSIGVDAAVGRHVVAESDAVMPMPYGPADVAWYDFQGAHFGGTPGGGGNAVFSAHVDYHANVSYAGVRYRGPGMFADLDRLRPGDVIEVVRAGETLRYAVSWSRVLPAADLEAWGDVIGRKTPIDSVTLFTCDGIFDGRTISYSHRLVVRAERLTGTPRRLGAPVAGSASVGVSGTTHPAALAGAQRWPVDAIFARAEGAEEWLVYRPGAPRFVSTLLGHLREDSFVIVVFR